MVLGIVLLFGIYLAYLTFSSDNTEVTMYVRTSGKRIALGVHQERRHGSFHDAFTIEFSLFILFLSFTFTKYRT